MKILISACGLTLIASFDLPSAFEEPRPDNLEENQLRLTAHSEGTYQELTRFTMEDPDGSPTASGGGKTSSFSIPGILAMRGYRVNPSKLVSVISLPTSSTLGLFQPSFPTLSIV